jgi:hypothetical protein
VARLAEASQNLRSAKTVVSLSPHDFKDESLIGALLQPLLHRLKKSEPDDDEAKEQKEI